MSLKNKIQNRVMEDIFASYYKPHQILTEKELIGRYACSKSPVREALVSLCSEGVLRNIPRCGYEVIQLTRDDIEQILQYRLILETGVLKASYQKITAAQMKKLEDLNAECIKSSDNLQSHWVSNCNFHLYLVACSGNDFSYKELKRALEILYRAYAQYYWNKWDNDLLPHDMQTHELILQHIREQDMAHIQSIFARDLEDFGKG